MHSTDMTHFFNLAYQLAMRSFGLPVLVSMDLHLPLIFPSRAVCCLIHSVQGRFRSPPKEMTHPPPTQLQPPKTPIGARKIRRGRALVRGEVPNSFRERLGTKLTGGRFWKIFQVLLRGALLSPFLVGMLLCCLFFGFYKKKGVPLF